MYCLNICWGEFCFLFCLFGVLYKPSTLISSSYLRLGKFNSIFFEFFVLLTWISSPSLFLLGLFISLFIVSQIYWMFCGIWFNIFFDQGNCFFLPCFECQRFFSSISCILLFWNLCQRSLLEFLKFSFPWFPYFVFPLLILFLLWIVIYFINFIPLCFIDFYKEFTNFLFKEICHFN